MLNAIMLLPGESGVLSMYELGKLLCFLDGLSHFAEAEAGAQR